VSQNAMKALFLERLISLNRSDIVKQDALAGA
jgi:hypothetical protein